MGSDLRTQLIDRMNLYGFSEHTKHGYVSSVKCLAKFYNQSPDQLTDDQVRDYLRHPVQAKGGKDELGVVQIEQDIELCKHKYPGLICRAIAAQFIENCMIAIFEFTMQDGEVKKIGA